MSETRTRTLTWRFARPPAALWPALGDTQRFNEAAGLPKHGIEEQVQADGSVRYFARARKGPFELRWEEIPVEWVDGAWFRHLRLFQNGPISSLRATLEIEPDGAGGSLCRYRVDARPANPLGSLMLATGFFPVIERLFTRLAYRADAWAAGEKETKYDARAPRPSSAQRARVEAIIARIEASAFGHGLAGRLADWIASAQEMDLGRIRPLDLARRWRVAELPVVEMCLQAVREGLLESSWDLLCPRCRGAKLTVSSLDRLPVEAHCGACNIGYDRDFARNVELTLHPAPAVRPIEAGEYCLFGPMSTPHVKAQVRLAPGERKELPASLAPGDYRFRTLEIGGECDVTYSGGGFPSVVLREGAAHAGPPVAEGRLALVSEERRERTVIVEDRTWLRDALTAHRVTTLQAFRDLFAAETLAPGDQVSIAQVTLMFTDLRGSTALYERIGDAAAYALVREHFAYLSTIVRGHDGAIVKTIGDAVMAAFAVPENGVKAALAVQRGIARFNQRSGSEDIVIKVGLHAGPCIAVTLNDRLDYFGGTVNLAARLQGESTGGDIVVSTALAADPGVAAVLAPLPLLRAEARLKGFDEPAGYARLPPA